MKSYAQLLSEKTKKAGKDCMQSRKPDRAENLLGTLEELMKEAEETKTLWIWSETVKMLGLNRAEQLFLCVLWGYPAETRKEADESEFWQLYQEVKMAVPEADASLPRWIYESGGKIVLSPVLFSWLEGELPNLPKGASLRFPEQERAYGLEEILTDSQKLFAAADRGSLQGILCIEGEKGSGRTFCMEQICAMQELPLLIIDAETFSGNARELYACILCAVLYDAYVCVKLGNTVREKLLEELSFNLRFFGIIKEDQRELEERPEAVVYTRRIQRPVKELKNAIVRDHLENWMEPLSRTANLSRITGRQLPMGDYLRYIGNIWAELETGTLKMEHIQIPSSSGSLNFLPATRNFRELKLPTAQYEQLRKISKMIAAREAVMGSWGFGNKFTYGNGMSVLFYGAPGTGKTMAAQVLANDLGMPLYRVDLSQLISKYIGETQKNIGRIFEEAEKCDCILLFDEADAIFTKRSEVSDAQDRYSNAETAYLLQRIEQYTGVCILATNLLQNFDEAFRRRISYMVHFPMPDVELRKELWETIFPKETPLEEEVDLEALARAFELSGASIKNAALHGALLAKSEGSKVGMKHLLDGIRNEYGKQGKSFGSSQKELLDAYQ